MARKRSKKKKKKSKQSYIPIVVLHNQIPVGKNNDLLDLNSKPKRSRVKPTPKSYLYHWNPGVKAKPKSLMYHSNSKPKSRR